MDIAYRLGKMRKHYGAELGVTLDQVEAIIAAAAPDTGEDK